MRNSSRLRTSSRAASRIFLASGDSALPSPAGEEPSVDASAAASVPASATSVASGTASVAGSPLLAIWVFAVVLRRLSRYSRHRSLWRPISASACAWERVRASAPRGTRRIEPALTRLMFSLMKAVRFASRSASIICSTVARSARFSSAISYSVSPRSTRTSRGASSAVLEVPAPRPEPAPPAISFPLPTSEGDVTALSTAAADRSALAAAFGAPASLRGTDSPSSPSEAESACSSSRESISPAASARGATEPPDISSSPTSRSPPTSSTSKSFAADRSIGAGAIAARSSSTTAPRSAPSSRRDGPCVMNTGGSSSTVYSRTIRPCGQSTSSRKFRKGSTTGRGLVTRMTGRPPWFSTVKRKLVSTAVRSIPARSKASASASLTIMPSSSAALAEVSGISAFIG